MPRLQPFPDLSANFVPVPASFFEELLGAGAAREELLVTLYLLWRTYAFDADNVFIPLEEIVQGTGLSEDEALTGLEGASTRGTVLGMQGGKSRGFYLLNTAENTRVMGPLLEAAGREAAPSPAPAEPEPPPSEEATTSGDSAAPSAPDSEGLQPETLEKIRNALGRKLTRDEKARLEVLGARDDDLRRALDSLITRGVELYSSDRIIYEYESLVAGDRRSAEEERRRTRREEQRRRQLQCKRCNGLGYVFIGANVIDECTCRKDEG